MTIYLQDGGPRKADALIKSRDAEEISSISGLDEVPEEKVLVCVVDNGPFEAAAVIQDERDWRGFFEDPTDPRSRRILLIDKDRVPELQLQR